MGRVMKGIYSNIQFVQYTNHVYEKSTQNMKVCECGVCVFVCGPRILTGELLIYNDICVSMV